MALDDLSVCAAGAVLAVDLLFGRWAQTAVTGLVIDLGEGELALVAREACAHLGDPSLAVGYWLPEHAAYVDETGQRLEVRKRPIGS